MWVARAGIEPATFHFSGGRSYQLSYLAKNEAGSGEPPKSGHVPATQTGLEPATSAVTGRRANQLRHWALLRCGTFLPERLALDTVPERRRIPVPPTGFEPVLPP